MTVAKAYVPNDQLREHRLRRGLTLEAAAEALARVIRQQTGKGVGINAEMIGKYERGERRPRPLYQRAFVLLYGASHEQLGFRPSTTAAGDELVAQVQGADITRHGLLRGAAAVGATALMPSLAMPRRVDPEAVRQLRSLLAEYAKLDNLLGPAHVLALVSVHIQFIGELLTVASGRVRSELLRVGGWYAEFAGWLHQDAGNLRAGMQWTDRALSWAEAAEDPVMTAYVLMRKSNQASSAGDGARALGLARAALRRQDRLTPRARALVLRQEARGHALAGDGTACARAIAKAQQEAASTEDQGEADKVMTGYCTPSYIEAEAGDCWLLLGQPQKAVTIFERGLAAWPSEYQRDRGLNLARLAVAHAASREPEQACAVGQEALAVVRNAGSARAVAELHRLPALLADWPDAAPVVELQETLATLS
jgi:tetratricopeptide (TPR) repeat protein